MNTKKIKQTVCVAGLAALVTVSVGCRANKLTLLSDRNMIPPPYKSPQLTQNAPATVAREMPTVAVTQPIVPANNIEQPVLPGGNPVFVPAGAPQDAPAQPQFVTPEDISPKAGTTAKPAGPSRGPAAPPPQPKRTYTVVKGDTLSDIAYMYMISWRDLAAENNLTEKSVLKVNQKLVLPPNAAKTPRARQQHKSAPKSTASAPKSTAPAPKGTTPAAPPKAATPKHPLPADGIYTIVANDNLWDIAKHFGLKSEDIMELNPNVNWNRLQIGQKIKLPVGKSAPAQPKQAAAAPAPAPKPADNKAAGAPPPPPPNLNNNAQEPPKPILTPAQTNTAPPPPPATLLQPNDAPKTEVPNFTAPQDFPGTIKPITPTNNNPPIPGN